jgi:Prp8 binding protein
VVGLGSRHRPARRALLLARSTRARALPPRQVHWLANGEQLVSSSADKSVRCWDVEAGVQVKRASEHSSIVNSVAPLQRGPQLLVSAGDDALIKLWDVRVKRSVQTLGAPAPVCAVTFSAAGDQVGVCCARAAVVGAVGGGGRAPGCCRRRSGRACSRSRSRPQPTHWLAPAAPCLRDRPQVYSGGVDNTVLAWELRKGAVSLRMPGHSNTVTGLAVSPDGHHLLSNSMDNTLRIWDMRPFAPDNRCVLLVLGASVQWRACVCVRVCVAGVCRCTQVRRAPEPHACLTPW